MIQFGEWLPDQPDYMNAGVVTATNVFPAASGYASINEFVAYSGDATDTILGIFAAKDNDGNIKLIAGDSARLYEFDTTDSGLDDITNTGGVYSLTSSERWRFVQFGETVIAAGGINEELQKYTLSEQTATFLTCQQMRQRQTLLPWYGISYGQVILTMARDACRIG